MKTAITAVRILFFGVFIWLVLKGKMMIWLGIFGITLLMAPFYGRLFCGWICPMNTVMIPTEWVSKHFRLQTKEIPQWLKSPMLPWMMLGATITLMIVFKKTGIDTPILLYMLLLSIAVTLRYKPEVFHNSLCPFGLLQSLGGQYARRSERVNTGLCNGCKRCERVCHSNAVAVLSEIRKAEIAPKLCHQCFNCQLECPKGAIAYTLAPMENK